MSVRLDNKFMAWAMWFCVSLFFSYQFILRVLPNIMMDDIMQRFGVDATAYGQFSGLYYIGYTLMHIPIGLMLDRIGPKKVVPICAVIVSVSMLPLIYGTFWMQPVIGRIVLGMGSSAATIGCFKIVSLAFHENKFNRMLGLSIFMGFMGAMYGGAPLATLISEYGPALVVHGLVVVGLIIAAGCYIFTPEKSAFKIDKSSATILDDLKEIFSNKHVFAIALLGGLMVSPVEGFADVWGSKYLQTVYGVTSERGSFLSSLIFLGFALGSPFISFIADKTRAFFMILIVSGLIMGLSFIAILTLDLDALMLAPIFFLVGVCSAYQIVVLYLASVSVPHRMVGLATACANMTIMIFGYVFHTIIGAAMDHFWTGQMEGVTRIYDASAYNYAISIIPISLMVAAFGLTMLYQHDKKLADLELQEANS